ncbi:MAG: hypothetical protein QOG53_408 [Frankiales bacterium]|jgi:hypothetical protein|nr:hypothetical protein [Frankiales bacterium]
MTRGAGLPAMAAAADALPPPPTESGTSALQEAMAMLWPAPATVEVVRRGAPVPRGQRVVREHLLIPDASRPRLVVPARERRAGAAIARRRGDLGRGARLRPVAAGWVVRTGLADVGSRDRLRVIAPVDAERDDVEAELSKILGRPVVVGLSVGSLRVNRKPILHVLDHSGHTLAFVKVGHTPSARELVSAEAVTLSRLADQSLPLIDVPRVLHIGPWHDLQLLVLSQVGNGRRRVDFAEAPFAAMRELAAVDGITEAPVSGHVFMARLRSSMAPILDSSAAQRFANSLDHVDNASAQAPIAFGAWHGDWTPWNMTNLPPAGATRVALWDWERFDTAVPIGFDALHYRLQALLQLHGTTPTTERTFLDDADTTARSGGATADMTRIVTALYVAEIAARYLTLLEQPGGAPLARRSAWILPLLETCAARL